MSFHRGSGIFVNQHKQPEGDKNGSEVLSNHDQMEVCVMEEARPFCITYLSWIRLEKKSLAIMMR